MPGGVPQRLARASRGRLRGGPGRRPPRLGAGPGAARPVLPGPDPGRVLRPAHRTGAGHPAETGLSDVELPVVRIRSVGSTRALVDPLRSRDRRRLRLDGRRLDPARIRRGRDRGRPGRPGRRGLRRVGRAAHAGDRGRGDGRAGRDQLADPQLPRLPAGRERDAAGVGRVPAGVDVRGRVPCSCARPRRWPPDGPTASSGCPTAATVRAARWWSPPGSPTAGSTSRARGAAPAGRLLRRRRHRSAGDAGAACSSSAAGTRPGRPRCTWPGGPTGSPSSSAARRWRRACREYLIREIDAAAEHRRCGYRTEVVDGARQRRLGRCSCRPAHRRHATIDGRRPVRPDRLRARTPTGSAGEVARDEWGFLLTGRPPSDRRRPDAPAAARPACPACSPSATCAAARSSGSPRRWARVQSPIQLVQPVPGRSRSGPRGTRRERNHRRRAGNGTRRTLSDGVDRRRGGEQ